MAFSIERIIADAIEKIIIDGAEKSRMNVTQIDPPKVASYPVEDKDIDGDLYVEGSQGNPMLYVILDADDNIIEAYRFYYQFEAIPYYTNGYKKVSEVVAQTIIDNSALGGLGGIGG